VYLRLLYLAAMLRMLWGPVACVQNGEERYRWYVAYGMWQNVKKARLKWLWYSVSALVQSASIVSRPPACRGVMPISHELTSLFQNNEEMNVLRRFLCTVEECDVGRFFVSRQACYSLLWVIYTEKKSVIRIKHKEVLEHLRSDAKKTLFKPIPCIIGF